MLAAGDAGQDSVQCEGSYGVVLVDRMGLVMTSRTVGGWTVLALDGEVDVYTCQRVTAALDEAGATSSWLVIDCARLVFCDSSFLAALVQAYKRADGDGGTLVVAAAQRQLRLLLTRTGLDQVIDTYPSVAEAVG